MIYLSKKHHIVYILLVLIVILFFLVRLPNLTLQPIFADEAIYIRWAQVMRSEPTLRFLPLSDGKTPLFMWLMIPLFKIFADPLFAGRFLSITSGLGTLIGVFTLGSIFFNRRVAIISSFLVATTPMFVFFDRLALVDSMLTAFGVWSLIFALLVVKHMRLDLSFILGYLLGGAMLTKPPGFFYILALPTSLWLFNWSKIKREQRILKLFLFWLVSIATSLIIYNVLRLGPGFSSLSSRNQDYIHPVSRLLEYPLDPFVPHLKDILDWFPKFLTWPLFILVICGLIYSIISRKKIALATVSWLLLPLLAEMALLKTFTMRYILFSVPPMIILASLFLDDAASRIKKKYLGLVITGLIFVPLFLNFNIKLLTDPATAPLPKTERRGYLEDWTAGYGLKEIAAYLANQASKGPIVVGTEGYFGTLPDGLYIYLDKTPNISIVSGKATISAELLDAAKTNPTYFVTNKSRFTGDPEAILLQEYPKAFSPTHPQDAILLFKINHQVGKNQ